MRVSVNITTLTFRALQASHARGGITGECGGALIIAVLLKLEVIECYVVWPG